MQTPPPKPARNNGIPRLTSFAATLLIIVTLTPSVPVHAATSSLSLNDTLAASARHDIRTGPVRIAGTVAGCEVTNVVLRVTTSRGQQSVAKATVVHGHFKKNYPADFAGAPPLSPGILFVDAARDARFAAEQPRSVQAEIALILHAGPNELPELPSAFTADLRDQAGHVDQASAEWPVIRSLVNLYMRSKAAQLVRVGRANFDLNRPEDLAWFKDNLTLFEFDYRDRNWSQPLGKRVARTFWQAVWDNWFNVGNNHPQDGNPANRSRTNLVSYTFANDFADVLIMTVLRKRAPQPLDDNLAEICTEGTRNLLAMQHREASNFARTNASGKREHYTAGAFRYGLFENGTFLTEGTGWFYNPKASDYRSGGVFNGRAVWALGEVLRHDPTGPLTNEVRSALALALKFCLHDGATGGYVKQTRQGNRYWRDVGEHAYLTLGMLAASEAAPALPVRFGDELKPATVRELSVRSLNALADLAKPTQQWSIYPDVDAMAIAALARGAKLWPAEADAKRWRETAIKVTDAWLAAKVDSKEWAGVPIHFGLRRTADRMTYIWPENKNPKVCYYQTGHWIHALAEAYALTGAARYRERTEAMIRYLCGDNPWHVRLFNELGAVYNWTEDTDGDGLQDLLRRDFYPESTAFCQIGILRFLETLPR